MNILHRRFQANYKHGLQTRVLSGSLTSVTPTVKTMSKFGFNCFPC